MRAAAAATLRTLPRVAVGLPPKLRRRLTVLLAIAGVLAIVYYGWFRNSSLVRVEKVTVTGLTTERAPEIRAALSRAARGMTTLNADADGLRKAVASEPVVRNVTVESDFPHGLKIDVTENVPRALLVGAGRRVAVAGNGTVLTGQHVESTLPVIRLSDPPDRGRVGNPSVQALVQVAGAAPLAILGRLSSITRRPGKGIVAVVRNGPDVYLGEATQLGAKWADAVAILADRRSQGAAYVDVTMPDRPVAGGLHIDLTQPPGDGSPDTTAPVGPGAAAGAAPPGTATPAPPTATAPQSQTPVGPGAQATPGAGQ
jgi:cell division septal protein FtsQ